jgi:hypothetical protein
MKNSKSSLTLKIVLALFLGASTVMTLLGAVGTACLAWNGDKYGPPFKWIVAAMPMYQVLVYVSLVAGVALAIVTYAFLRGDKWFYLGSLIFLIVGGGAAAYQMYLTSSLKGVSFFQTAPTNVRFYITVATLIAFLIVRFPGIWNKFGLGGSGGKASFTTPTGAAFVLMGVMLMTAPLWASPEHVIDGFNYVTTLQVPLLVDGLALTIAGVALLSWRRLLAMAREKKVVTSLQ